MLEITNYIKTELIIPNLESGNKIDIFKELIDRLFANKPDCIAALGAESLLHSLMERENAYTTGLGNHAAFPHARVKECDDFCCVIGYSKKGIEYGSIDGKPCHLFCLMVSCIDKPYIILQVMADLASLISEKKIDLSKGDFTAAQLRELIVSNIQLKKGVILAKDVMRSVEVSVRLTDSVQHAARTMHLNRKDILPVLNDQEELVGEISCLDIFSYGIPDFFNQLKTVSFVNHIDPFEKYFKYQKKLLVKDVFKTNIPKISQQQTIMEIIFEMTIRNHSLLFVTDQNKLVGIIDRFSIIDKVLFF